MPHAVVGDAQTPEEPTVTRTSTDVLVVPLMSSENALDVCLENWYSYSYKNGGSMVVTCCMGVQVSFY